MRIGDLHDTGAMSIIMATPESTEDVEIEKYMRKFSSSEPTFKINYAFSSFPDINSGDPFVRETKSYSQHGGGALVERVGRVGRPYGHYSFAHNNTNGNHNGFSGGG
ncbi:hypothetical protein Tco_1338057 [Tanacetum coccineum]